MRCSFFVERMAWNVRSRFGSMSLLIQRRDITGQQGVSLTACRERLCLNQDRFPKNNNRSFRFVQTILRRTRV